MVDALFTVNFPSPRGASVVEASCLGLGAAHNGSYTRFRCVVGWLTTKAPLRSRQVTVWARPLSGGRVCASVAGPRTCRVVGTFTGVLCAPSPWNPPSNIPRCMFGATLRALEAKLTPLIRLPPTALELTPCRTRGPTSASSTDRSALDCDFNAYVKRGDGAVVRWSGRADVRYRPRARGYVILRTTVSHLRCAAGPC
jgi:hypothetical protein